MYTNRSTGLIGNVTKRLKYVDSTNEEAKRLLSKSKPSEGTVIIADEQRQGKGQYGNTWVSSAGDNLTLSIILYPKFLQIDQLFYLNIAVSLALWKLISGYLDNVSIKWPNDIYVGNDKIAGILIENTLNRDQLQHCIIGIGINVNQIAFPKEIPNATSIRLKAQRSFELNAVFKQLLNVLSQRYDQLKSNKVEQLKSEYESHLYQLKVPRNFRTNQKELNGQIQGVDATGCLLIKADEALQIFSPGEIEYL